MKTMWRYLTKTRWELLRLVMDSPSAEQRHAARAALIMMDSMDRRVRDDEEWKTINGTHVCFGEGGTMTKGPQKLKTWHAGKSGQSPKQKSASRFSFIQSALEEYERASKTEREHEASNRGNNPLQNEGHAVQSRPRNEQDELKQFRVYDVSKVSSAERLKRVNPNYGSGSQWGSNCQRTVVAYELQQRGYDVVAQPHREYDAVDSNGIACWDIDKNHLLSDKGFKAAETPSRFKKTLQTAFDEWGDGARAIVRVKWRAQRGQRSGDSHFFSARRENGTIVYEDPQTGQTRDLTETLSHCTRGAPGKGAFWVMRVDNRRVTENVKYAVSNREDI